MGGSRFQGSDGGGKLLGFEVLDLRILDTKKVKDESNYFDQS